MARAIRRLTEKSVKRVSKPGWHPDGDGLYLFVSSSGSKSWAFRFAMKGEKKKGLSFWMGMGSLRDVTIEEAREKAAEARKLKAAGKNPIAERDVARRATEIERAKTMTFGQCAEAYIATHSESWSNAVHRRQWRQTLDDYVLPRLGKKAAATIDSAIIADVLKPIWAEKPETGSRVRSRIENILNYATSLGARTGENPAALKVVKHLLPDQGHRVEHHAALPWSDLNVFFRDLKEQKGIAADALAFTILTAARTGEVIGATWAEIDMEAKTWTVPSARMKSKRDHRVPLTEPALAILAAMRPFANRASGQIDVAAPVFPGWKAGTALSNMAMTAVLKRMGRSDITVHGFRSCFRDWVSEATDFQGEIAEAALAHVVGDKVEAAYRRGDLFEKRRRMMDEWATYCTSTPAPKSDAADDATTAAEPLAEAA